MATTVAFGVNATASARAGVGVGVSGTDTGNCGGASNTYTHTHTHTAVPIQIKAATSIVNVNGTPITSSATSSNFVSNRINSNNCGNKRGHIRSASLENANVLLATKATPVCLPQSSTSSSTASSATSTSIVSYMAYASQTTGTLKSRNEQKRIRNKYGSHNNLDDLPLTMNRNCNKFQNIRHMFEFNTLGGPTSTIVTTTTTKTSATISTTLATATATATVAVPPPPLTTTTTTALSSNIMNNAQDHAEQQMQSLPVTFVNALSDYSHCTASITVVGTENNNNNNNSNNNISNKYQTVLPTSDEGPTQRRLVYMNNYQHQIQQTQHYQQQQCVQQQYASPLTRKTTPTKIASSSSTSISVTGNNVVSRSTNITELNENLNIIENSFDMNDNNRSIQGQQQQLQQQQVSRQHYHHNSNNGNGYGSGCGNNNYAINNTAVKQSSISDLAQVDEEKRHDQVTNLLRPIAFKPIPFEPDYSIPNRYYDVTAVISTNFINNNNNCAAMVHSLADRYGSTPSLAPMQGNNFRFGSTTDLRHSGIGIIGGRGITNKNNTAGASAVNVAIANDKSNSNTNIDGSGSNGINVGAGAGTAAGAGANVGVGVYSSNNYCNSLMARRRCSRTLKINDSMESIRHTPDCEPNNQNGNLKPSNRNSNNNNGSNDAGTISNNHYRLMNNNGIRGNNTVITNTNINNNNNNGSNNVKYLDNDQCDMTPSPSDSGISELEAALKDRDSELSYLRQAMEQNDKDKETHWENETKRLRCYYEGQQHEYLLEIKKLEQMLAMQQFQFKQNKLRYNDQTNKLREQVVELKNECEILKTSNITLKNSERNLKDRSAYIEEQLEESQMTINHLRNQLEESEWKVCERNGELALLKTQLKEANNEITLKEHTIVHLKHENIYNVETQIYQSLQDNQLLQQHQQQHQQQQQNDNELNEQNRRKIDGELKQLNKIVILKDQVILALTNELAKLRKELSDLVIFHEYGEEPSGKYTRLKQQLDNLTEICNKTRQHTEQRIQTNRKIDGGIKFSSEKVLDDMNLELIMNCLKTLPVLDRTDQNDTHQECEHFSNINVNMEKNLTNLTSLAGFVCSPLRLHNLPDIAVSGKMSTNNQQYHRDQSTNHQTFEESTLDTLIEESNGYAEQIAKLRKQLDEVRINFELEKRQWSSEKEKVLQYQKQLQTHYINMYQKLRNLQKTNEN